MTKLEFDDLTILASAFDLEALGEGLTEREQRICRRHAHDLRQLLRYADTAPGGAPDPEPFPLPTMTNPDHLPKIEEA